MALITYEKELTILMPCLNEAETLATCIKKAKVFLNKNKIEGEVLIADNGSTDNSFEISQNEGVRIIPVREKGYGNALIAGIKSANGKFIIMGDADDSYDFSSLETFIDKLRDGFDLVMGNRFKGGIKKGAMPALHRYFGNPVLSFVGRLFFHSPIGDFHCGLRGFRKEKIENLVLVSPGMEFASEMVVKASLNKLRITEVPIILYPDGRSGSSHLRTWNDGWRHLRFLLIFSPRWLFLFPGILMFSSGFILSIILAFNQIRLSNIHFDVHTLLYSFTFLFLGYQFVSFYIFTKYFGIRNGLLPNSKRFEKSLKYFNLEIGIVLGTILFLVGIALSIYALRMWSLNNFGNLNPSEVLRIVIPATFSMILGLQIIINSFFLSILNWGNKIKNDIENF
jgi:glycosyltransferase involved in cell wall biosynthesis